MFTREININTLNYDGTSTVNPNLRELIVTVRYKVNNTWQTYTLDHLHLVVLLMRTDSTMRPATLSGLAATAGYSLVELMVAMGMFTLIMGVTLTRLASIMQGNDLVMTVSDVNDSVRAGMDLMVRDLLQTGSGLPSSHAVSIPNGAGLGADTHPGSSGTGRVSNRGRRPGPAGGDAAQRAGAGRGRREHRCALDPDGRQRVPGYDADRRDRHVGDGRAGPKPRQSDPIASRPGN